MKLLFACLLASVALALTAVGPARADETEIIDPIHFEIGERVDGDMLLDLYYTESDASAGRGTHSVTINWAYTNINFIRVYVYADDASYEHTGLPADQGSITVTAQDVDQLMVTAYLYGTEEYYPEE